MIEVKDLGLEIVAQSKKEGLVLRFDENQDIMPFLRANAERVRAINAEEPFIVIRNIRVDDETAIRGRTQIGWHESTAIWHTDMVDGVALINNRKGNKRGKTLWVPKGVMRTSAEAVAKMNLPDDIEVFQRKASISVPGFLNPESTFFVRLEESMADEIRECDWYLNDDSMAIFDDRKGLHRGKYTNHAESLPLISFYTHENY